ncbi:MAG TPA: cytochrome c [Blastocatellia bacterium]|nr:cytochrome c [Blastocatellia bacterium]
MHTAHCTHNQSARLILLAVLLGASLFAACSKPDSVVSNAPPTPAVAAASTPEAAATPATATPSLSPSVAPATSPAVAATPGAATSPAATPPAEGNTQRISSLKTIATTQPMETPKPEPTPTPAPTPEIKRDASGKIIQEWQAPAEYAGMRNPLAAKADAAKYGQYFYGQVCADCHGREGLGNGPLARLKGRQATNLASEMVQANTDGELFYKVSNPRLPHPKLQARLTDEQRWYIVSYLRTMRPAKKK